MFRLWVRRPSKGPLDVASGDRDGGRHLMPVAVHDHSSVLVAEKVANSSGATPEALRRLVVKGSTEGATSSIWRQLRTGWVEMGVVHISQMRGIATRVLPLQSPTAREGS